MSLPHRRRLLRKRVLRHRLFGRRPRACRPSLALVLPVALAATLAGGSVAQAAPGGAPATVAQITGLSSSQLSSVDLCPPAAGGRARCAAQAIVLRSDHRLVRPRIHPRPSFTQVFPHLRRGIRPAPLVTPATAPGAGTPAYLQQAYDLTYLSQTQGASDTVAIVDAYDDPAAAADLSTFRSAYGLPPCTTANGCFRKLNEHGGTSPLPAGNLGWEGEISLDLDAVSSLCPLCHIVLVEATTSSLADMNQAVVTAAALGARQISNSWSASSGSPLPGTYSFPGVAVIAATGDSGYAGPSWDNYPAALPGVTAAGGTTLTASTTSSQSPRGWNESAWSLSGGWGGGSGCDTAVPKPAYQTDSGCTGRSYADVSADANPSTGLGVYDSGNGGWMLLGGTSLATPLIAAYEAVTGISGASPQWAYVNGAWLNDPASGSTGSCAAAIAYICNARVGYDGPTGAGSISGAVASGAPGIGGPGFGAGSGNSYTQSVSATGATLTGGIYPNGVDTTYRWQYGTTSGYGQQTAPVDIGPGRAPVTVSSTVAGLAPGVTYHYRLVAQNASGTSYGYDYTFATGPAGASPPVLTSPPVISGTPTQGQTLRFASSWNPSGSSWAYQWKRSTNAGASWTNIPGATGTAYVPGTADLGALIEVTITANNAYGSTSATSNPAGPIASGAPKATSPPTISGTPTQGQTLRFASSWNPSGTSWAYQWKRSTNAGASWTNIPGATGAAYTLGSADRGALIEVTVAATNPFGTASSASRPVGPVA